jgi:tetratricopeptide (TPR) repeat protein
VPAPKSRLGFGAAALFLVAASVAIYAPLRRADFVNYDDYHYVVENSRIATGLSAGNVAWAFTAFSAGNWHPVTWISHQADCQLYGLVAGGHHVTNLVLHAINAVLVLCVLYAMTGALWRSAFVAALFAVHPLNVESVAWVSERKNVLSTLFWLLTMWAYVGYARKPSLGRYASVALFLALGLMSKPMVVTLPCVLLLLDYWPLGRWRPGAPDAWRQALALVREKLPLFALVVLACVLTVLAQKGAGAMTTLVQVPLASRVTNAVVAYVMYLVKMIWPVGLAAFYPHPGFGLAAWKVLGCFGLLLAATLALRRPELPAYLALGWLWYLGTLVPVIGIVQVGSQAMADRYAYVPLLGPFIAVVWGLADSTRQGRALAGAGVAIVVALTVVAARQATHWHSSIDLFEHARSVTRGNYVAYTNLGLAYNKLKKWDQAIHDFDMALKIMPDSAEAWGHRGLALAKQGKIDDAIVSLERALAIYPKSEHAHNNLGIALRKRDPRKAVEHLRKAVELDPDFTEAKVNLGAALLELGEADEARKAFAEALAQDPKSAMTHFRLGSVLLDRSDLEGARGHFETSLKLNPTHADTHNSLGVVHLRQGDLAGAMAEFQAALRIEPEHPDAHSNVGIASLRQGRKQEGLAELETAIRLNPRHADAHATLGAILAQDGTLDLAIPHFRAAVEADATNAIAQNNLGAALLQKGDIDGAVEHLRLAVKSNPRHADAQSNLGIALLQKGDVGGAIEHLETALRVAPDHRNAQTYLKEAQARAGGRHSG